MKRLIQITDSHLGISQGDKLLSMDADESLVDVLQAINRQHAQPDLILATGDIANHASLAAYQRFYTTVTDHLYSPMVWLPGNHDDPDSMEAILPGSKSRVVYKEPWLIIMLDSHVPGETYGKFAKSQLDFLNNTLVRHPQLHVMICMHHQPVPIGSHWMDRYIIQNTAEFWEVISPHENIKAVVWGHVHQEFDEDHNGIRLLATPSTCVQFKPMQHDFMLDTLMPGYRWFELHDDGRIDTGICRVENKDYGIDFESSGY